MYMNSSEHLALLAMLREDAEKQQFKDLFGATGAPSEMGALEGIAASSALINTPLTTDTLSLLRNRMESITTADSALGLLKEYMPPGMVPDTQAKSYMLLRNIIFIQGMYNTGATPPNAFYILVGEACSVLQSHSCNWRVLAEAIERWDPWLSGMHVSYYHGDYDSFVSSAKRVRTDTDGVGQFLGRLNWSNMGNSRGYGFFYRFVQLANADQTRIDLEAKKAFLREAVDKGVSTLQVLQQAGKKPAQDAKEVALTTKKMRDGLRAVSAGVHTSVVFTSKLPVKLEIYQALYRRIVVRQGLTTNFEGGHLASLCKKYPSISLEGSRARMVSLRQSLAKRKGWWEEWEHYIKGTQECVLQDESPLEMEVIYSSGGLVPF